MRLTSFSAALPAGTLSGAPKVRAMEIIDELESGEARRHVCRRGRLLRRRRRPVDACIVLRTGLIKDGVLHVQRRRRRRRRQRSGLAEYEETLHKSAALRRAAAEAWRFEEGR